MQCFHSSKSFDCESIESTLSVNTAKEAQYEGIYSMAGSYIDVRKSKMLLQRQGTEIFIQYASPSQIAALLLAT